VIYPVLVKLRSLKPSKVEEDLALGEFLQIKLVRKLLRLLGTAPVLRPAILHLIVELSGNLAAMCGVLGVIRETVTRHPLGVKPVLEILGKMKSLKRFVEVFQ
jgi:hypothetical protein